MSSRLYAVCTGRRWGAIDKTGEEVIKPQFDSLGAFSEGFAAFEINGKHGVIDTRGNAICEPTYSEIRPFKEGRAVVKLKGRYGYINGAGELVVPCHFFSASEFSCGLAAVQETMMSKFGYIDIQGNQRIKAQFLTAWRFSEAMAAVGTESAWGFIDTTGSFLIQARFSLAYSFSEGLAAVSEGRAASTYGFIDSRGAYKIKPKFNGSDIRFSEGFAAVWEKQGFGFIDHDGRLAIPYRYYSAGHFCGGRSLVGMEIDGNTLYGFINQFGDLVIEPQFTAARDFRDGMAVAYVGEDWGWIDPNGEFVWRCGQTL